MNTRRKTIRLLIVLTAVCALLALGWTSATAIEDMSEDAYSSLRLFSQALALIESKYVEEVEIKKLVYGAVSGMLVDARGFRVTFGILAVLNLLALPLLPKIFGRGEPATDLASGGD